MANTHLDPNIGKATQFGANGNRTAKEAGKKSGKRRRFAKSIMEALDAELEKVVTTQTGDKYNGFEAITRALITKAVRGDIQAARLIVELNGDLNKTKKVEVTGKDGEPIAPVAEKPMTPKEAMDFLKRINEAI